MGTSEVQPAAPGQKRVAWNHLDRSRLVDTSAVARTTLMRHARLVVMGGELSQSPPSRARSMGAAAPIGALVATCGRTLRLPPAGGRTGLAAVALPAVATTAQENLQAAASTH